MYNYSLKIVNCVSFLFLRIKKRIAATPLSGNDKKGRNSTVTLLIYIYIYIYEILIYIYIYIYEST